MTSARRPPWTDVLLALAFLLAGQLELHSHAGDGTSAGPTWLSSLVTAAVASALVLRTVAPRAGLLVACGALIVGSVCSAHAFFFWTDLLPLAVLVFASAGADDSRFASWGWTLGALAACSDMLHVVDARDPSNVVMAALVLGGASAAARLVRRHTVQRTQLRQALGTLAAEQAAREEQAVASERLRIAEEIGQVVVGAIEDLAQRVARARDDLEVSGLGVPEQLVAAERSASEALDDVRSGMAPLAATVASVPGLRDLDGLVEGCRGAGLDVSLTLDLTGVLDAGIQLVVYRLVQEALTNALKHGDGERVDARVSSDEEEVVVEVRNRVASGGQRRLPSGGHGLVGMRERVAAYGGELEAGPTEEGYAVRGVVPRVRPSVLRTEVAG